MNIQNEFRQYVNKYLFERLKLDRIEHLDIDAEYALIEQKKSTLSASDRERVQILYGILNKPKEEVQDAIES